MLGSVQRAVRSIEVTEETLSLQAIEDAISGPGHFLGHPQTLELMESEYLYPALGDRHTPDEWEEMGAKDIRERARERLGEIMTAHYPSYIDPAVDARLRADYPIRLPRAAMGPKSGRW